MSVSSILEIVSNFILEHLPGERKDISPAAGEKITKDFWGERERERHIFHY